MLNRSFTILILSLLVTGSAQVSAQDNTARILSRSDREPVPFAHIMSEDGKMLTSSDEQGYFTFTTEPELPFIIHALGYNHLTVDSWSPDSIYYLIPTVIEMQSELLVEGKRDEGSSIHSYHQNHTGQNMDQFMEEVDGVNMIRRGAFAWEPAVRAQSDQRLNLMIDGMPVFKACVDKMDPVTSYVDISNLSSLNVDKNGSNVSQFGSGNSSVNLMTRKADRGRTEWMAESGFQPQNLMQSHRASLNTSSADQKHALRLSGSYRNAQDMVAGGSRTIENTQFEKFNLNANYRYSLNERFEIETAYITDKAYDIGYPALLMDATRALADIGRVQLNIKDHRSPFQVTTIMLYANSVRHTMDDFDRDVANREVMRGMFMPMYGETTTIGFKVNGEYHRDGSHHQWYVDAFGMDAFGDMDMQSLDPNISDMYVYNLNEVQTRQVMLGFKHQFMLAPDLNLKLEESIRFKSLGTANERFASHFEGIYNRPYETRQRFLFAVSGQLLWMPTEHWSLTQTAVFSERMGNHMELFGHYIYNYVDGFFYDGNPWMRPERSVNYEIHSMWKNDVHSISLSGFSKYFLNYIDGFVADDLSTPDFQFKRHDNVGRALMTGGELRTIHRLSSRVELENRMAYLFAHNLDLGEPLPLIPPLNGSSGITYRSKTITLRADVQWGSAQNRIASQTTIEDRTPAFAVFGFQAERDWLDGLITTSLRFNNLTDRYYYHHTSIGNIPENGFNVMGVIRINGGGI